MNMMKRLLSFTLALVLVAGLLPMSARAEGCQHHEHDSNCGYAEDVPCGFVCPECTEAEANAAAGEIQALINALPEKSYVTVETASEVEGKLNAVDEAKSAFLNT